MKFKTQLLLGNGVTLALMVSIAIIVETNIKSLIETSRWVTFTYQVISQSNKLEKLLVDMETGERGFLITGKEEFLESYTHGKIQFDKTMIQIKQLVSENDSQVNRLQTIQRLTERWQQSAAIPVIKMRREVNNNKASMSAISDFIGAGTGKIILDQIRMEFKEFIRIEYKLLDARNSDSENKANQTEFFLIFGTLLAILLGLFISLYISRILMRQIGGEPADIMMLSEQVSQGQLNLQDSSSSSTGILASLYNIINSLQSIHKIAESVATGDLTQQVEVKSQEDVLAISINSMITSLSEIARNVEDISLGDYRTDIVLRSEVDTLGIAMQRMSLNLRNITQAAETIASGNLKVQIKTLGKNDALGIAMQQMSNNLQRASEESSRTNWLQKGQVLIAEALREESNMATLGEKLLIALSRYVDAQLGTVYQWVEATDKETGYLELISTYAYTRRKHINQRFQLGESLVGQVAKENKIIIVEQVPESYIQIKSSLGELIPQNLILIPFSFHKQLRGVLELGFVQEINEQTTELLSSIQEPIGTAFENINAQARLAFSLKESLALEAEIRTSEKRTSTIIESSLNSIITISQQDIIESCNSTTEKMFGFSKEEMLGKNIKMLMPETTAVEHDSYLKNHQKTGDAKVIDSGREVVAQRKDGTNFHIHLSVTEMLLDDKISYLWTVADITEQIQQREKINKANRDLQASTEELASQQEELRQTNETLSNRTKELENQKSDLEVSRQELEHKASELKESSRYKSEFLANMSHELRTPLNSLLILAKFLADNDEGNLSEDEMESATVIHESGSNLLQLINDILDLSKVESGHMTVHNDAVLLSDIQHFMESRFKHMAKDKSIVFNIDVSADMPTRFQSDYTKLGQILTNLISNALKFTQQGSVTLSVSSVISESDKRQWIHFAVIDTGIGIPENKQRAVFEAFQQADGSTNRQYGGTGLGLSIALSFANLLGGKITVESEEGKGSQFTLIIPYCEPSDDQKADPELQKVVAQSLKPIQVALKDTPPPCLDDRDQLDPKQPLFLLIEDDVTFAKSLIKICHQQKVQILLAADGETGLTLAKKYKFTGIILDYMLPGIDGGDVLGILQTDTATRNIPVHVISAVDDLIDMGQLGAIGQLTKPVSKTQIQSVLKHLLEVHNANEISLLVVEDDEASIAAMKKLLRKEPVKASYVTSGVDTINALQEQKYDSMILDLELPDMTGFELLDILSEDKKVVLPPIIIYSGLDLSDEEHQQLQTYTSNSSRIIIKSVKSPDRLLDEIHLFIDHVNHAQTKNSKPVTLQGDLEKLKGKHILLVDDDMRNTFSLAKVLRSKRLEVVIAPSGQDGLNALDEKADFDLVLMDIMMPEMDGYETMRRIRAQQQFKHLPIIALTANAMRGDKEKCIDAGANDYLAKPVDVDNLLVQMSMWL